ncbi:MAG: acyl-CoA dehydrogenase family protein [Actinobacteria bacterium]|nr:acyl-CoA dehydrogenase family protein [Actinomycetota bacterium]
MSVTGTDSTLELLADVADEFARPDAGRARRVRDAGGRIDHEAWERIAAAGWIGITVPEELGGAGLGSRAVAIVARRLGYAAFPEPFVAVGVLGPELLAAAGEKAGETLAETIEGRLLCAVASQGFEGGLGEAAVEVEHEDGALSGRARFLGLADADLYLVAAREPAGIGIHAVPADAAGLEATIELRADGAADVRLVLDRVAADSLIAAPDGGPALAGALDAARLALSAELVGLAERVLEITLDYLRQRRQFGKPIGAQQALQHRAVDLWIQVQLAGAALEAAIDVLEAGADSERRAAATSGAKARAAAVARRVCNEALQLHGAIGFTDEYELGIHFNRALALAPWLGTAVEHRRRFAELSPIAGGEGAA